MTTRKDMSLEHLLEERLRRAADADLGTFVEWFWPVLEPTTPFLPNWHIDLICDHLQDITDGKTTRLSVNAPPRYMKTLLGCVFWPVWEWLRFPGQRWIFVSHSEMLAQTHSLLRRRLIQSDLFQRVYGDRIQLTRDQHAKLEFHNTRGGVMLATSMGGAVTGKGGGRIVIDDPHSPQETESDRQRQRAVDLFSHTFITRLDSKADGAIVVLMQRLHVDDLTGWCQELGFTRVSVPVLVDVPTTVAFPRSSRVIVRQPNVPLWPEREDLKQLAILKRTLGTYGFAGQYLQEPFPREGGMFPRAWWGWYEDPPADGLTIQSWDLSFKDGSRNDFVVGLVARRQGGKIYLLDRVKAKLSFTETAAAIQAMREKYPMTQATLIEDTANGPAIISYLKASIPDLIAVTPQGGKQARAAAAQPWIEAGQLSLPSMRTAGGEYRAEHRWTEDFVTVCEAFPRGSCDDDVDALTQLVVWCQQHTYVEPADAWIEPEPYVRLRHSILPRRRIRMFHRSSPWRPDSEDVAAEGRRPPGAWLTG